MASHQASGWVLQTVQRYKRYPGLTPRPARIARLLLERPRSESVGLDISMLVYAAAIVRGQWQDMPRWEDWDRALNLEAIPGGPRRVWRR